MPERINPKLLSYASIIDEQTLAQAKTTSSMPFVPRMVLMPDAHLGKGATVGSVIPTERAIMPAAVGVDIGCGMNALRTQYTLDDLAGRDLAALRIALEAATPLSAGQYNETLTASAEQACARLEALARAKGFDPGEYAENWRLQLGTLGSGNHFQEVTVDETGRVWLFLHSGSRGVGNRIAQRHIKIARKLCERRWISLPDPDLAYLVEGDPEFSDYINQMMWAQDFARENRAEMMRRMRACFESWVDGHVVASSLISCHHNYTARERVDGKDVWLSRKGAIDAHTGVPGLIPGSMGTASYVVSGKGNRAAMCTAPHGAGREYGRRAAERAFTVEQLQESMEGIEWSGSAALLDEIPAAYKDIDQVMADAADLVEVRHTLRQIVNVKGE
ncbi:RtcB family protein [Glycomyces artemisiae]|uniref:3'-phosphate/5'-hydroxy nucleic acid ligase n=1 Tax=Glycomyces artemisiae TaxID=1076443 RepID=A0A2T0UF10_9ACTN|nr:RtcB family protein [Glycomyces artemisiae]PRY56464.1 tRNA-splicing ligase RtcB [Glycomyces artemisiae]